MGLLLAVSAGLCAAVMGVAIRLGTNRGAHLVHLYLFVGAGGVLCFLPGAIAAGWPPARVLAAGAVAGLSQYLGLPLVRMALARGPLTSVWSAASLGFLPVSLYAVAVLGERLTSGGAVSLAAGVGCVLLASTLQPEPSGQPARRQGKAFAAMLAGILLLNAVAGMLMKHLSSFPGARGDTLFREYQCAFLALVYGGIGAGVLLQMLWSRPAWTAPAASVVAGLVAAVGSLASLALVARVAHLPAAVVFTACNVSQVAGTFVLAAVLIGEPRTRRWYAALALALLAVLASQAEALLHAAGR